MLETQNEWMKEEARLYRKIQKEWIKILKEREEREEKERTKRIEKKQKERTGMFQIFLRFFLRRR